VIYELERIQKEAVVAYLEIGLLSRYLPGGHEENQLNLGNLEYKVPAQPPRQRVLLIRGLFNDASRMESSYVE
jgi:hypothetical protein